MARHEREGVVLPEGETGSSLFHRVLGEARARWPAALGDVPLPTETRAFRGAYAEALTRFEAARLQADERLEIGRFVVERSREAISLLTNGSERSLTEALADPGEPFPLDCTPLSGKGRLVPRVPYRGRTWTGRELVELAGLLVDEARASKPVAAAAEWLVESGLDEAGEIDLEGRRCAVIGAGAEIAPTLLLLEAGADVLWIDTAPPPESLAKDSSLSGRLFVPESSADLLADPCRVAATLRAFAADTPIDVGLYAYAPGGGREWRLTESMNAIVDSLPSGCLRSVSLLISPTTPVPLPPETLAASDRRHASRPGWQRAIEATGLLGGSAHVGEGDDRLLRNIVSVQGPGYQAAQYVGKTLAVERWATAGPTGQGHPVCVSANIAAITMTRSLKHPVFEAGFAGASSFQVETLQPDTTRALNGLLTIHDWLDPDAPGAVPGRSQDPAERARRLLTQQVHGGLFALGYGLEPTIRVGALIGLARRPGLIPGFARALVGG
jgi:hypothetical protein